VGGVPIPIIVEINEQKVSVSILKHIGNMRPGAMGEGEKLGKHRGGQGTKGHGPTSQY
jgi:hypothetical protein